MRFPIFQNDTAIFPKVARCPWCKKGKVFEPHSMAILEGGACLMNRRTACGGTDDRMDAFLQLTWHGAHDHGIGDDRELYTSVPVAEDCVGGQFELYFCSTKCLRAFLNSWVDELDKRVLQQKKRLRKKQSPQEIEEELRALGIPFEMQESTKSVRKVRPLKRPRRSNR
jgi:hypothetical protein